MAIKSILGGKSKNLFDIGNAKIALRNDGSFYSTESYDSYFYALLVEAGQTYTVSCDCFATAGEGTQLQLSCQTGTSYITGTRLFVQLTTEEMINAWQHIVRTFTVPSDVTQIYFSTLMDVKYFRNFQIEKGSTATDYVPYELTSYKSIMKVSDVCQLVPISDKADEVVNEVTFTNNHDGGWTISGTPSTYTWYALFLNMPLKNGHKYLNTNAGGNTYVEIKWRDKDDVIYWEANPYTADENSRCDVTLMRAINATGVKIVFPQLFDLTEMYGAGNEPKTVAEFKAKFPNDYYPYSPSRFVTSYDERMPCKTKNLFSSSVEVGVPSSTKFDKSEKRLLEDGKWYIGLTGSNYYSRDAVLDYSIMENSVYIKWRSNGYSAAKCIYCEPNTTYSFTKKYSLIQGHSLGINVGFYTEDGTFISVKGETASPRFVFTTPENCKYVSICLSGTKVPNNNFGAGYYSDLQLVKGTTVTDYVPYDYV